MSARAGRTGRARMALALAALAPLVALMAVALACGGKLGPLPTDFNHPSPAAARITIARASAKVKADARETRVSASCPADSQMIGGGFSATDVFEYDALVTASYPSGSRMWTAIAGPSDAFTLNVEAYCLNQELDLGISILKQTGSQPECFSQTALGSGFDGEFASGTYYLLCASQHAARGGASSSGFNPQSSSHSYAPGSITLTCPTGALAISGDEGDGVDSMLASSSAGPPYLSWVVVLGGDKDVTVSTTCAFIPAPAPAVSTPSPVQGWLTLGPE